MAEYYRRIPYQCSHGPCKECVEQAEVCKAAGFDPGAIPRECECGHFPVECEARENAALDPLTYSWPSER